ncbi:MAG: sensor histidine kinase, partial [Pseudomonas sp.]
MPFSVTIDPNIITVSEHTKIFSLGAHLANFYGAFWSTSHYQSPQAFTFDNLGGISISVPPEDHNRVKTISLNKIWEETFRNNDQEKQNHKPLENMVIWKHYKPYPEKGHPEYLLAYINLKLAVDRTQIIGTDSHITAGIVLDLSQINDYERTMEWSIYDHFTLVAPSGQVLIGALWPESPLHEGVNFKPEGLVFKLVNHHGPAWTAIYAINYRSFFRYALWPLASLGALLLGVIAMGWGANRWYRRQVILPAREAHASIAESEAFSRVVIDTAPTGLCVVRRADNQVLMENQRAQQSPGSAKLISALERRTDQGEVGETYLEIDGRHLQVGFVSTRYQGQD